MKLDQVDAILRRQVRNRTFVSSSSYGILDTYAPPRVVLALP
jgi:hypothetical protein